MRTFLRELQGRSPHTIRSYRIVLERFFLWLDRTARRSLAELRREDALSYRDFLVDPQPAEHWIAKRKYRRSDPRWRPFLGPLSRKAILREFGLLRDFFDYLVKTRYLPASPLDVRNLATEYLPEAKEGNSRKAHKGDFEAPGERFFEREALAYVWRALELRPQRTARQVATYELDRWLLSLAYLTALRTEEMATHTMGSFRSPDGGRTWGLHVLGKGAKKDVMDCSSLLIEALFRFRIHLGCPPTPHPKETLPLAPRPDESRAALSTRSLYRILTRLFRAGEQLAKEEGAPAAIVRSLATGSPHWLRHSRATHLLDDVLPRAAVQRLLRHSHDSTLDIYTHATGRSRAEALRRSDAVFQSITSSA